MQVSVLLEQLSAVQAQPEDTLQATLAELRTSAEAARVESHQSTAVSNHDSGTARSGHKGSKAASGVVAKGPQALELQALLTAVLNGCDFHTTLCLRPLVLT